MLIYPKGRMKMAYEMNTFILQLYTVYSKKHKREEYIDNFPTNLSYLIS